MRLLVEHVVHHESSLELLVKLHADGRIDEPPTADGQDVPRYRSILIVEIRGTDEYKLPVLEDTKRRPLTRVRMRCEPKP